MPSRCAPRLLRGSDRAEGAWHVGAAARPVHRLHASRVPLVHPEPVDDDRRLAASGCDRGVAGVFHDARSPVARPHRVGGSVPIHHCGAAGRLCGGPVEPAHGVAGSGCGVSALLGVALVAQRRPGNAGPAWCAAHLRDHLRERHCARHPASGAAGDEFGAGAARAPGECHRVAEQRVPDRRGGGAGGRRPSVWIRGTRRFLCSGCRADAAGALLLAVDPVQACEPIHDQVADD